MSTSVLPVFFKSKDLPDAFSDRPASVLEICLAAERTAGSGSTIGAQLIGGLWRLYPATKEARSVLLVQGLRLRGVLVQVQNSNPFVIRGDSGEERVTTKVWVDNVPISVADKEIEHSLLKSGCELRSSVQMERARNADQKLTRFLTGRRFVFISVPDKPLEKTMQVSIFKAKIYHREQKLAQKVAVCSNCLENGHHSSVCSKEVVCMACNLSGHKRGDPKCLFPVAGQEKDEARVSEKEKENESANGDDRKKESDSESANDRRQELVNESKKNENEKVKKVTGEKDAKLPTRGRQPSRQRSRQTTLQPSLKLDGVSRSRSETPKRRHSGEASSPETSSKLAKRDCTRSHYFSLRDADLWDGEEGE